MSKYSHEKSNSDNPIHNSSKVDYRYHPTSDEGSYSADTDSKLEYDSWQKKYDTDQGLEDESDGKEGRMATPALVVVIIMWFMMLGAIVASALDLWPE